MTLAQTLAALTVDLDLQAWVHVLDVDSGDEVGAGADAPVVAASVFKLPVLVEFERQADEGRIDPDELVEVPAGRTPTAGPTGLSVVSGPVTMSWRDLALSMMSVSDNRATDLVIERLGLEAIGRTVAELGLTGTVVERDCAGLFVQVLEDLGMDPDGPLPATWGGLGERLDTSRPLTPLLTNRTTPRETTTLLRELWRPEHLSAVVCERTRATLGRQVWPHRLRSGFPETVRVSGKTGTFGPVRNRSAWSSSRTAAPTRSRCSCAPGTPRA